MSGTVLLLSLLLSSATAFEAVTTGEAIPPVQVQSLEGAPLKGADLLHGTPAVIVFWRLGQPYSKRLLTELSELSADYSEKEAKFIAICSGEVEPGDVAEAAKSMDLRFPVYLDPDRSAYGAFGVIVAPAVGFVDGAGRLQFYYAGYRRDFQKLARAHLDLLAGKISASEHEARLAPAQPVKKNDRGASRYGLARRLIERGDLEGARALLSKAWEANPEDTDSGIALAWLLLREGKNKEALTIFTAAEAKASANSRWQGGKGLALLRLGRAKEGQPLIEEALAQGEHDPLLYYALGLQAEKEGNPKEAGRYYKEGLEAVLSNR